MKVAFWEHGHAYQPRRIIDGITNSFREVAKGVHLNILGKKLSGRNWFDLMLKPGSTYDLLIGSLNGRTIDVEPITLHYLKKINLLAYEKLHKKVVEGQIYFVATGYAHSILPLMVENNIFDAKVNITWGLRFYQQTFSRRKGENFVFFWLSECAYSKKTVKLIVEAVEAVFSSDINTIFILDELQAENIDSGIIYNLPLGEKKPLAVFRCHWLSDAYAFSSDLEWILTTFREDIAQRNPKIIGVAVDAETYGGAYNPQKTVFLSKLKEELIRGMIINNESFLINFITLDKVFNSNADLINQAKVMENSSWSDYEERQLIRADDVKVEGIIARKAGGLCRWTGCLRDDDKLLKETYFIVFEWVHPLTKKRFVRVLNSLWKKAFNIIRTEGANVVRKAVFDILERVVIKEEVGDIILSYDSVIFELENEDLFVDRFIKDITPEVKKAVKIILKAYRLTNQDSMMSCPTFWQNFDTEVTWTALSLVASGLILAAQAYFELQDNDSIRRIADIYQELFIDFDNTFKRLAIEYNLSLDLLYKTLTDIGKRRGFDVEERILKVRDISDIEANEITEKLYQLAFGDFQGKNFMKTDGNTFLILSRILDKLGKKNEARDAYFKAKLYEWSKCIGSVVSPYPIPTRVGILHAKHFPKYKEYLRLPTTNVEIETEILIGEAHTYDP